MAIYDSIKDDNQESYLGDDNSDENPFLTFFSYFLLMSTLIPISLVVTLEIVKICQCYFISQDATMFSIDHNRGVKISTTTINEELGQVSYIFSDKTGTLTQNIMVFKAFVVGDEMYGSIGDRLERRFTVIEEKKEVGNDFYCARLNRLLENDYYENEMQKTIYSTNKKSKIRFESDKHEVQELLKLLCVCHDCEAEEAVVDGEKLLFYQGASPDEITLVDFAQSQGFEFIKADGSESEIKIYPKSGIPMKENETVSKVYKIHKKMPFDSTRKRMSVLFTDPDDGLIKLYTKGADSIIEERLDKKQYDEKFEDRVKDFLARSSAIGLRTLLMAMRVIEKEEFAQVQRELAEAENDLNNREKRLLDVYERFERGLVLIGATAVEDKLQDNVPDTLEDFRRAGISTWMLTGDKLETAKNIGYS